MRLVERDGAARTSFRINSTTSQYLRRQDWDRSAMRKSLCTFSHDVVGNGTRRVEPVRRLVVVKHERKLFVNLLVALHDELLHLVHPKEEEERQPDRPEEQQHRQD